MDAGNETEKDDIGSEGTNQITLREREGTMAFTQVSDLPTDPAVRIFFTGLMILEPSTDSKTCEVFIHRSAPDHQLTIEVRQKQAGRPDIIKMRHVGPLPYALRSPGSPKGNPPVHGMLLEVVKAAKGVRAYNAGSDSDEGESLDFAINLNASPFHEGDVGGVDRLGGQPSILLNDGVFYTAAKTDTSLVINLKQGETQIKQLAPFAGLIGANIYLDDGDLFRLQWQSNGLPQKLDLQKPAKDESYEIYVINDPLYESEFNGLPRHDEFKEYYKILPDAPKTQFRLEVKTPIVEGAPTVPRGSTITPCMPVIISR